MTDNNLQPADIMTALDNADEIASQHQGQKLGRLRDLGLFCFPGDDTDKLPAYLPTTEQWETMALKVRDDQDRVMREQYPEMFSKSAGNSAGATRKIERA